MKLFIAIVKDRHTDPQAYPFSELDKAIAFARDYAHSVQGEPDRIEETVIEGFLFNIDYSSEGDSVWVVEKTLDEGDETLKEPIDVEQERKRILAVPRSPELKREYLELLRLVEASDFDGCCQFIANASKESQKDILEELWQWQVFFCEERSPKMSFLEKLSEKMENQLLEV